MQPYFFPYLGYFGLIHDVDRFLAFDTPQFTRHSWMNRNRVLHPDEGWQYVTAPVRKQPRGTPMDAMALSDADALPARISGQLQHYARRAPHHAETDTLVRRALSLDGDRLVALNVGSLRTVAEHLGITTPIEVVSDLDLDLPGGLGAGDWALEIADAVGATAYLNAPGGRDLFDPAAFERRGIDLLVQRVEPMTYATPGYEFEPNLSVIDALMWAGAERVAAHLRDAPPPERL